MDGRFPSQKKNEVLEVDGIGYVDNRDKAEQFAKTYRGFARLPTRHSDRALRRRNRELNQKQPGNQGCEQPVMMQEMLRVIDLSKNNKAAGDDNIAYELIKHLGPNAKERLLLIYNKCWSGEGIPSKWRTAIIKPSLKEGKDPKQTVSYRPISLTSCMGKILEKIVADRLLHVLEDRNLLSSNQAGFRPDRSTTDQVLKFVQGASDEFHAKEGENHRLIATFYDYEKAFDKVWRDGLIHKLHEMKIPTRFIKYIRHFLSGRKTWVEVNGERSKQFFLNEGLPQGSCISPLLFLTYINDIDIQLNSNTIASLFADDTTTWIRDGKVRGSNRDLAQEEVNKIVEWADKWKMAINSDKTRSMVTSPAEADLTWDPALKIDGSRIKNTQDHKHLGIIVSNNLRFTKHIDAIIAKCRKRINILKCLATKSWGCSLETQRRLYIQYIRSVIEYASSSWHGWISNTHIIRLQRMQNEAMRAISGLTKTCPVDFLHLETNLDPIADRLTKNDHILWDRYERFPANDSRKKLVAEQMPTRLKSRKGFRAKTSQSFPFKDLPRETTTPRVEPWLSLPNLRFEVVQLEKKKEDYKKEELREMSIEKISTLNKDVNVYTDGSTSGKQTRGGAGIFIENNNGDILHKESRPAGKLCSSYTGECVALLMAFEWIATQPTVLDYLICTDSKSLHEALRRNDWTDTDPWLKKAKVAISQLESQITLLWLPSHCDIPGNDKADRLANSGTKMSQTGVPVPHTIVKAKIRRCPWKITNAQAKQIYGTRRKPLL